VNAAKKNWWPKSKNKFFVEFQTLALGKEDGGHSAKVMAMDAVRPSLLCRVLLFADYLALDEEAGLPSAFLCRVPDTRQRRLCHVQFFCRVPLGQVLCKEILCRVPNF